MSSPFLSEKTFDISRTESYEGEMTVGGTINKTLVLFLMMLIPAALLWNRFEAPSPDNAIGEMTNNGIGSFLWGGMIIGFIVSLVMMFKKSWAPYLAPVYAIAEGVFLGAISLIFNSLYDGIVLNAVGITLLIFAVMLLAYRSGLLRATPMFTKVIVFATMGVGIFYVLTIVLGMFNVESFYHGSSPLSIGISALIAGIAAFNLILDFDFIEKQSAQGAPKYMEWFAGVALLITLVWLYLEVLRLLSKLQSRNS
ncbi:MAG: Bax inhibitor-1/YccA family protein [Flavobacteriaceae bacterium]|nr:Bax inhibitor-1/YccA family protein [Flavobacteriaceae bacterium]